MPYFATALVNYSAADSNFSDQRGQGIFSPVGDESPRSVLIANHSANSALQSLLYLPN